MIRRLIVFGLVLLAVEAGAKERADKKVSTLAIAPPPLSADGGLPNLSTAAFETAAVVPTLEEAPAPDYSDSNSCLPGTSLLSGKLWQSDVMNFDSEHFVGAVGPLRKSVVPIPEFVASIDVDRRNQVVNALDPPHGLVSLSGGMYLTGR